MTEATHRNGDATPARAGRWPARAEPPRLVPAEEVGPSLVRYRIVERLARSPQDARYLAHRLDAGTLAELRVLSGDLGASPGLVRAFTEQAERVASAARDCPGIATVHECERVARGALLVTVERPPGPTLRELLQTEGPLAIPRAVGIAIQIAEALEQAHGLGLVHGGLHPDNVVLTGAEEAVSLTHFGFDRLLGSPGRGRRHPAGIDDRVYQAPEQAAGKTTARSDVYAVGVLLYEMLAGAPPAMRSRRWAAPKPLREQRADVTPSLDRLVTRALQAALRRRPASISAMCTDLWAEVSPYGRPTLPDRTLSWPSALLRRPLLLVGAILGAGALTAAAGMLIAWLGLMGSGSVDPRAGSVDPVGRVERAPAIPAPAAPAASGQRDGTARDAHAPRAGAPPAPSAAAPWIDSASPPSPRRPAPSGPREPEAATPSRDRAPASGASPRAAGPKSDNSATRDSSAPPPPAAARETGDDPGAIIDWLIGEGARQQR